MIPTGQDSLKTRATLNVGGKSYAYYSLPKAGEVLGDVSRLPFSMKVLLENLLRFEDGVTVTNDDLQAMVDWQKERRISREIQYRRSCRGRSGRDARRDEDPWRRPSEDQSASAGPPSHRP
jgi:aconitate hydratase